MTIENGVNKNKNKRCLPQKICVRQEVTEH